MNSKTPLPSLGQNLEIREERDGNFSVPELKKIEVQNFEDAFRVF